MNFKDTWTISFWKLGRYNNPKATLQMMVLLLWVQRPCRMSPPPAESRLWSLAWLGWPGVWRTCGRSSWRRRQPSREWPSDASRSGTSHLHYHQPEKVTIVLNKTQLNWYLRMARCRTYTISYTYTFSKRYLRDLWKQYSHSLPYVVEFHNFLKAKLARHLWHMSP